MTLEQQIARIIINNLTNNDKTIELDVEAIKKAGIKIINKINERLISNIKEDKRLLEKISKVLIEVNPITNDGLINNINNQIKELNSIVKSNNTSFEIYIKGRQYENIHNIKTIVSGRNYKDVLEALVNVINSDLVDIENNELIIEEKE